MRPTRPTRCHPPPGQSGRRVVRSATRSDRSRRIRTSSGPLPDAWRSDVLRSAADSCPAAERPHRRADERKEHQRPDARHSGWGRLIGVGRSVEVAGAPATPRHRRAFPFVTAVQEAAAAGEIEAEARSGASQRAEQSPRGLRADARLHLELPKVMKAAFALRMKPATSSSVRRWPLRDDRIRSSQSRQRNASAPRGRETVRRSEKNTLPTAVSSPHVTQDSRTDTDGAIACCLPI